MSRTRVAFVDALGLRPFPLALKQARRAVFGDGSTPKTRFGTSSLHILTPTLAVKTWLGGQRADRRLPIMNFVNRTPTPVEEGWSVRVTQVRDWRGGVLTYDSHNGTDFVAPPGLPVCAAAPGVVASIRREFNRGGLKLYIDHGAGLMTTSNHLSATMVSVGQHVARGEVVALSGYSGIDAVVGFPWVAPHLHFNVWLGGIAADPYAADDAEVSLWRRRNDPVPLAADDVVGDPPWNTSFSAAGVQRCLESCVDADTATMVRALSGVERQGAELLIESITYPTRFAVPEAGRLLFDDEVPRTPRLDLPFSAADVDGTVAIDR